MAPISPSAVKATTQASLEEIVKDTTAAFLKAKADGVLEAAEVVQIAVGVAQKLRTHGEISGSDKKAVTMFCLREGLKAAGGLPGLDHLSAEARAALQEQLLAAAGAAIDVAVAVANGKMDLRKVSPKQCLGLCCWALKAAAVALPPADAQVLQKALAIAAPVVAVVEQSASQGSEAVVAAAVDQVLAAVAEKAPAEPLAVESVAVFVEEAKSQ